MRSHYQALIAQAAQGIGWDPLLLEAQILQESSGEPDAFRWEPGFYLQYLKGRSQWAKWGPLAACSYGLMQIIYATARDDGFEGPPESLFDPGINLTVGCRHLEKLRTTLALQTASGIVGAVPPDAILAAYNGGLRGNLTPPYRNQAYVQRVRARYALLLQEGP